MPDMTNIETIRELRDSDGRLPRHTTLGGYPIMYVTLEGATNCADCASITDTSDPAVAADVYWEGPAISCDDCNAVIESAYGDPDDETPDSPTTSPWVTRAIETLLPSHPRGDVRDDMRQSARDRRGIRSEGGIA